MTEHIDQCTCTKERQSPTMICTHCGLPIKEEVIDQEWLDKAGVMLDKWKIVDIPSSEYEMGTIDGNNVLLVLLLPILAGVLKERDEISNRLNKILADWSDTNKENYQLQQRVEELEEQLEIEKEMHKECIERLIELESRLEVGKKKSLTDGTRLYLNLANEVIGIILSTPANCEPPYDITLRLHSIIRERNKLQHKLSKAEEDYTNLFDSSLKQRGKLCERIAELEGRGEKKDIFPHCSDNSFESFNEVD